MKISLITVTVAPLTVLPFQKSLFTYRSPQKLLLGTLVTIPFSGRTLTGVILNCIENSAEDAERLKEILAIENREPLTPEQIALAHEVSNLTYTPLGKVLKHFVPKLAKARISNSTKNTSATVLSKKIHPEISQILAALDASPSVSVTLGAHQKNLSDLAALLVHFQKKQSGQILVLVPDIASAVRIEKSWEGIFPEYSLVSLYHTKTAGQYYQAWSAISTGQPQIIIATRGGLFAPFKNLALLIQIDPNDEGYKQWDMSPRYHTNQVIPFLQNIWDLKYIEASVAPTLTSLVQRYPVFSLSQSEPVTPTWVNLKIERYQKNWGALSEPLKLSIRETLTAKKKVILYVHQSGLESFSVCKECRTIFRCPSCKNVLKLTRSDHYHCKHCGFTSALFPQCQNCKSIDFKSVGYGTEKVAKEVQKEFPGANVSIADKSHLGDHKKVATFLERSLGNEPDILVTTASFLRFPPLSEVALVAIIDADILLNLPGFRKDEQFVDLLERLKSILSPKGKLLVQSFHPESDLFQKIETLSNQDVLAGILAERKLLRYPPFYRALTLEERPKQKQKKELLQAASTELKTLLVKNPEIKKTVTLQQVNKKVRGQEKKYTLLRYLPPLPAIIHTFLTSKADTIIIDHDPLSFT